MVDSRLRRHIAREAAKLMYERVESEYFTAKRKAAARFGVNTRHQLSHLPSNREIRDEIQILARLLEGEQRDVNLKDMRLAALRIMRMLDAFEPRLIGSVLTGHVRSGSDIDIHVFSHSAGAISDVLDRCGLSHTVEHKQVIKHGEQRLFTHIHIRDRFDFELTMYPRDKLAYRFKSSITGKSIDRASVAALTTLIEREYPDADIDADVPTEVDRFLLWAALLTPLEEIKQDPRWHPEGDALFHSLQAFELARAEHAYDQEMMTAALLHDVGKAIDAYDHVAAGLEALEGTLTDREEFLIAHHMDVITEPGKRKLRRKLDSSESSESARSREWFEDLMALRDIDNRARQPGAAVCTLDEAIDFLREMESAW